jgi:hypothetical protein
MGAEETGKVLVTFCRQPSGVGILHRDLGRVHKVPLHLIEQAVVVFITRHFFQGMESKLTSFSLCGYKCLNYE